MNWTQLGKSITIASQRKWTDTTAKTWFKFDFNPATEGFLEVTQGDGNLTIGEPINISTDRSPVILSLPVPLLVSPQSRKLALKSLQKLKISISTLDVEPITINPDLSAVVQAIQTQQSQIDFISNQLTTLLTMPLFQSNPAVQPPKNSVSATIASSTTSVSLLAANDNRKGATIYNRSTATLFIDFDSAATILDCAVAIPPMGYYEVPFGMLTAISGIWDAVNGSAYVRELT